MEWNCSRKMTADEQMAFKLGYNKSKYDAVQWINVKDRLPEIGKEHIKDGNRWIDKSIRVLRVCKQESGKVMVKEGYYQITTFSDGTKSDKPYWRIPGSIDEVTHWTHLPEPPKEELKC